MYTALYWFVSMQTLHVADMDYVDDFTDLGWNDLGCVDI